MKKKKTKINPPNSKNKFIIFILILICIPVIIPLFKQGLMYGHDQSHSIRLLELNYCLKDGVFPVRWFPHFIGNYGNPHFLYYAPLFYYVGEIFHLLGFGLTSSVKIACIFGFILSGLSMYIFAKQFFSRQGALVSAIAYVYAPYHLVDIYVRGAMGEFFSFVWFPLILYFFYKLFLTGKNRYFAFACISYAGLLFTHNLMALIFTPFLILYILILVWKSSSGEGKIFTGRKCFSALILGLLISATFWLPALLGREYIITQTFLTGHYDFHRHFVYPQQLLSYNWGFGHSLPGIIEDGMSFQIGILHLLLFLFSFYLYYKFKNKFDLAKKKNFVFFWIMFFLCIFLILPISISFWELFPLIEYVQFPWRFLSLVVLATSFLAGGIIDFFSDKKLMQNVMSGIFVIGFIVYSAPFIKVYQYYPEPEYSKEYVAQSTFDWPVVEDYRPRWVKQKPPYLATQKIEPLIGQVYLKSQEINSNKYKFTISCLTNSVLQINTFWFPDWKVYLDGEEIPINYQNDYGLMQISVPFGMHEIEVKFERAPLVLGADILSGFGIIILVLILLWKRKTV